jgi:hypothetical protein
MDGAMKSLIVSVAALLPFAATARDTQLDGWGPFHFGVSTQDAYSAASREGKASLDYVSGMPVLHADAIVDGRPVFVVVRFEGGRTTRIAIRFQATREADQATCLHYHDPLVQQISKRYHTVSVSNDEKFLPGIQTAVRIANFQFSQNSTIEADTSYKRLDPISARNGEGNCEQLVIYERPVPAPTRGF